MFAREVWDRIAKLAVIMERNGQRSVIDTVLTLVSIVAGIKLR